MSQILTPADQPWRLEVPISHPLPLLAAEENTGTWKGDKVGPSPTFLQGAGAEAGAGHSRAGAQDRERRLGTRSWHLLAMTAGLAPGHTVRMSLFRPHNNSIMWAQ